LLLVFRFPSVIFQSRRQLIVFVSLLDSLFPVIPTLYAEVYFIFLGTVVKVLFSNQIASEPAGFADELAHPVFILRQ